MYISNCTFDAFYAIFKNSLHVAGSRHVIAWTILMTKNHIVQCACILYMQVLCNCILYNV